MADWQKGDLALCVRDANDGVLRKGAVYTVERPYFGTYGRAKGILLLLLEGVRGPGSDEGSYAHYGFIKVTPPSDMKAEPRAKAKPEQVAG